jgi:predicted dienelactone hydrolase
MQAASARDALPAPAGRHEVGRIALDWVDPSRPEIYSGDPEDRRELVAWVWYPAAGGPDSERAAYLPEPWTPAGAFLGLEADGLLSHALLGRPIATAGSPHPVLVMSPSAFPPLLLAAIAEELASHGYVVVGVGHTHEAAVTAFSDGRIVPANPDATAGVLGPQTGSYEERFRRRAVVCDYKAADLASVADHLAQLDADPSGPFAGRLDLGRLGAFGHSFGGNAALQWCRDDPRCRAAANLDGALWTEVGSEGLDRPALQLLSEHPEFAMTGAEAVAAGLATDASEHEAERAIVLGGWRTLHERARPGYTVQIAGATHPSFMDLPFLPLRDGAAVRGMLAATRIEPRRMWRVTCDVLLAFFGRHLDGAPAPLLDGRAPDHPELVFGAVTGPVSGRLGDVLVP